MERYVVIVSLATDYNRGDQALLWKTQEIIEDALDIKKIYVLENENEGLEQSKNRGLNVVSPILFHPSHRGKKHVSHENVNYSLKLKITWGVSAVLDFLQSSMLLYKWSRKIGEKCLNQKQRETFMLISNAEAIFVKGGGFIHAYGKLTDLYYIYYSLYNIRLALSLGRKVYILPNSFGPFEGIGLKKLIRNTLSKCTVLTSRESISQEMLTKIGIYNSVLSPDMAFTLKSKKTKLVEKLVNDLQLNMQEKSVAITVRPYRFPEMNNSQETYENYKYAIVNFIKWLKLNRYRPILVEHTYSKNDHENDRKCIDEIVYIMETDIEILCERDLTCEELKYVYSKFNYVVGTRFHSVIFSLAEGVPGIAISYSGNKATGIMKDMGLEKYVLQANSISDDNLINRFVELVKEENEYKEKLEQYIKAAKENYQELVKFIQDK